MENSVLLPTLLAVPLFGALIGMLMPNGRWARGWGLGVSLLTFLVAVALGIQFYMHPDLPLIYQAQTYRVESLAFSLTLRCDAISLWLAILTAFLTPLAIAFSFGSIVEREREYYVWMNALLLSMLGVFVAGDLLLFYVFFELTLVPMFFIIGIWGGPQKRYAAGKFFLFTFTGSVFTLAAAVYVGIKYGTFDIPTLIQAALHGT